MRRAVLLLIAVLLTAGCSSEPETLFADDSGAADADHLYTIPAGAGAAIDEGEPLEILPAELQVKVGEVIVIINEDDRGHLIGPFFVGAGETLRQKFSSPGTFIGQCSVHPSGQITLEVVEA
jgi:plastocyanin